MQLEWDIAAISYPHMGSTALMFKWRSGRDMLPRVVPQSLAYIICSNTLHYTVQWLLYVTTVHIVGLLHGPPPLVVPAVANGPSSYKDMTHATGKQLTTITMAYMLNCTFQEKQGRLSCLVLR